MHVDPVQLFCYHPVKAEFPVILLVLLSHCTFANAICKHSLLRGIYVILGRKLEIECYPLKRCCFDLSNTPDMTVIFIVLWQHYGSPVSHLT
jgi:hypothetical protein